MKNQIWLRFFAVVLGSVYLVSGIGKAMDINSFTDIVVQYSHEKMRLLAPLIVGTEITLGFAFLFGVFVRQFASISICMLVFFTIFIAISYGTGKLEDCGCFGVLLKIDPVWALVRNVVMIGLSFLLFKYSTYAHQWQNWLFGFSLAFGLIAFGITGYETKNTYRPLQLHIGSKLDKIFLKQYAKAHQKQLFFVFSPTCSHCLAVTERIKQYVTKNAVNEVIGFYPATSRQADVEAFKARKKPNFSIVAIESDSLRKIVRAVPVAFLVENKVVTQIYSFEIPTP